MTESQALLQAALPSPTGAAESIDTGTANKIEEGMMRIERILSLSRREQGSLEGETIQAIKELSHLGREDDRSPIYPLDISIRRIIVEHIIQRLQIDSEDKSALRKLEEKTLSDLSIGPIRADGILGLIKEVQDEIQGYVRDRIRSTRGQCDPATSKANTVNALEAFKEMGYQAPKTEAAVSVS